MIEESYGASRREGGFTLVELLIVIVILGVLATVTVVAVRPGPPVRRRRPAVHRRAAVAPLLRQPPRRHPCRAASTGTAAPRRTHFVDISSVDPGSLDQLVVQVNNTGDTTLVVYPADDGQPIGGAAGVVDDLTGSVNRLSAYPNTTFRAVSGGGLASIFASTAP